MRKRNKQIDQTRIQLNIDLESGQLSVPPPEVSDNHPGLGNLSRQLRILPF